MNCGHSFRAIAHPESLYIGLGVCALLYAGWGYSVLPCERAGKRPHGMLGDSGGVHWASTDPATIRRWWTEDPLANVGVATGEPSSLVVVDLDIKHGHDGPGSLRDFLRGDTSLHAGAVARTPSGGFHIWLRTPAGAHVPERPGILPGVDVKGNGGLVIAPPSCQMRLPLGLDGEHVREVAVPYEWETGCPCSASLAPGWMAGWLQQAPAAGSSTGHAVASSRDLETLKQTGLEVGSRNATMYVLACGLYRRFGTDPDGSVVVLHELRQVWTATDQHDFTWREVLVSAESARKFIVREQQAELLMMEHAAGWLRSLGY